MSRTGLSHGARVACYVLAIGVHAAAAGAFMLTPKIEPPPQTDAVEIELLAEITSEVAEEAPPAVAAQSMEVEQASKAEPGEATTVMGEQLEAVASLDVKQTDVMPEEVKEIETEDQPEAKDAPEIESIEDPAVTSPAEPVEEPEVTAPVELEKPVIEAPQAPALAKKPKAAAKQEKKKAKAQQRRASVAGSTLSKDVKRQGASRSVKSGGGQSSSEYRSVVNARLAARRSAIQSMAGTGAKGRVVVFFTIGSGGKVVSASVSKSSGNARLDSAARAVVASTSFPPPPGGSYRNGVPIFVK